MKLLILSQYYPPETGAPQNRLSDLAKRLSAMGVDVLVLTAMPNYPQMKKYSGYRKKFYIKESLDGIAIHRSFIFVSSSKKMILRLINYFSFVITSIITGIFKIGKLDYLICESPPLFLGISGVILSKLKGAKLILNVSDLWPESAEKLGLINNRFLIRITRKLEEFIYRKSEIITGQTQGIVKNISIRFPEKRIYWLKNGVDLNFYNPEKVSDNRRFKTSFKHDDFILLYAGIFGYAQGIHIILRAAKRIEKNVKIKFILIGDGPEKNSIIKEKENQQLENVFIFPSVPEKEMPSILKSIDASVIPLRRIDLFKGAIPSKIFESLAMEKPILLGVEGEANEIFIKQGKCGLAFEPENISDLANKILQLYGNPEEYKEKSKNCRSFVASHFDRKQIAYDLLNFIRKHG